MSDIVQVYPSSQSPNEYLVIELTISGIIIILGKLDLLSIKENNIESTITKRIVSIIIYFYYIIKILK